MNKIIIVILVLLVGIGAYFVIYQPNQLLNPSTSPSVSVSLPPNTHAYNNTDYGFTFSYPKEFSQATPQVYFLKNPVVQFEAKGSTNYPKTNLSEYRFSVDSDTDTSTCTWGVDGGSNAGNPLKTKISINGNLFYKDTASDAGAGNFYESRIFRIVHNAKCIELVETIHTTNVDNYPPEAGIKEVDKNSVWAELDQVLNSFKFTTS